MQIGEVKYDIKSDLRFPRLKRLAANSLVGAGMHLDLLKAAVTIINFIPLLSNVSLQYAL